MRLKGKNILSSMETWRGFGKETKLYVGEELA